MVATVSEHYSAQHYTGAAAPSTGLSLMSESRRLAAISGRLLLTKSMIVLRWASVEKGFSTMASAKLTRSIGMWFFWNYLVNFHWVV